MYCPDPAAGRIPKHYPEEKFKFFRRSLPPKAMVGEIGKAVSSLSWPAKGAHQ